MPWKKPAKILTVEEGNGQDDTASTRPNTKETTTVSAATTECLSVDESAFEAGKHFWMKLLVEQADVCRDDDDDDDANEDPDGRVGVLTSARKTSLLGREIEKTWSSGSPLSESSAFQNHEERSSSSVSPSFAREDGAFPTADSTPDNPEVCNKNQSRRLSVLRHWENQIQASRGIEHKTETKNSAEVSTDRSTTTLAPTPSNGSTTNGGTPRSFGDVTNRYQSQRHVAAAAKTPKPSSTFSESIRTTTLKSSGQKPSSDKSDKYHVPPKEETPKIPAVSLKTTIVNNGLEKNNLKNTELAVANGKKEVRTKPVSGRLQRRRLETLEPKPSDQNRFHWAYKTWRDVGLMEAKPKGRAETLFPEPLSRKAVNKTTLPASVTGSTTKSHNNKVHQQKISGNSAQVPRQPRAAWSASNTGAKTTDRPVFRAECDEAAKERSCSTIHSNVTDLPGQDIEPPPLTDSEPGGFQKILGMWRDQTNGGLPPATNGESEDADDDDFRKYTAESPDRMTKLHEVSAISVVSSELIVAAETSQDDQLTVRSEGFIDSDEYDESEQSDEQEAMPAIVILQKKNTYEVLVGESRANAAEDLVIRNVEMLAREHENALVDFQCECSRSAFSGNDDLINFFLPQMGMACTCGRQRNGLLRPEDPTAIENVLRPWQVDFLKSFGIHHGEQLVKARHRSGGIMARALRQWRKKQGMIPFKTSSCGMALHIWAKTSKSYVRSIRQQIHAGNTFLERPPGALIGELSQFLSGLPAAPKRKGATLASAAVNGDATASLYNIEPESQVEV